MKNIKRVLAVFLCAASVSVMLPAFAEENKVVVGEKLEFAPGSEPVIVDDRLMLPLRAVSEALDATVYWFDDDKRIQIVLYDSLLSLQIGNNVMGRYTITGGKAEAVDTIEMDVPAMIQNDRTYVPVRAISEAFSADVKWDNVNRTATIVPMKRDKNELTVAEIGAQDEGVLCAAYGVIGRDNETGIFYLRSLQKNSFGEYDKMSFCTPVKTSSSDDTAYGDYISQYWLEQFETENPSGTVVYFTGITSRIDGQLYLVINKTTTSIRSLGYYDVYMKSLGMSFEPYETVVS
ncbi:copper amine oxidase N-terminal domain-containing protein [Ructibacterium gallinarum]|uniref:Copper amine oxidase N-terminal domain-containing protein n=1 Tax=Ructibacterium gallinarum TaxID=2779355 RepID=A0A9D5M5K3_9FIRM|nr:copper amine oxidase N-terminal domain-containing protein [Ructibacterium gallinarum]MBE5041114.1 copper amine oxidase N-terminal domain-containing protein [Ructibacterium gallinarum]